MIDNSTNKPLYVSTDGDAGLYIMVLVQQIDAVRTLLDANNIQYWIDEDAISLNGKPEVAVVNLGHDSDAINVQNILDKAP
ncbi:MAG: hypothetical protein GY749_22985 [Desulfobacteraceae bacterium]|nr:hypothetical protein [Desulfobacteraceae bacterium]